MTNLSPIVAELERLYGVFTDTVFEAANASQSDFAFPTDAMRADPPVVSVSSRGRKHTVNGWYRPAVWTEISADLLDELVGDGTTTQTKRAEVVISSEVLREDAETVAVELLRGMLCHARALGGLAVPGESNYFDRSWTSYAARIGVVAEVNPDQPSKGWSRFRPTARLAAAISKAIRADVFDISRDSATDRAAVGSRMRKYACTCSVMRAANVVLARCYKCSEPFVYVDTQPMPTDAKNGLSAARTDSALFKVYGPAFARENGGK